MSYIAWCVNTISWCQLVGDKINEWGRIWSSGSTGKRPQWNGD